MKTIFLKNMNLSVCACIAFFGIFLSCDRPLSHAAGSDTTVDEDKDQPTLTQPGSCNFAGTSAERYEGVILWRDAVVIPCVSTCKFRVTSKDNQSDMATKAIGYATTAASTYADISATAEVGISNDIGGTQTAPRGYSVAIGAKGMAERIAVWENDGLLTGKMNCISLPIGGPSNPRS